MAACGGGGLYTNLERQESITSQITRNAFLFGSDFPADIVIPDIDGMRSTAFVVSTMNPAGVIAIDLDTNPLRVSESFKGLTAPEGSGYPSGLFVLSPERAFMLSSSHVVDFNPVTGGVNAVADLTEAISFGGPLPLSSPYDIDYNGSEEAEVSTITPSFPGGLAVVGGRLYITMSNYINPIQPVVAAPGVVLLFDLVDQPPYLVKNGFIVTSQFNPTGVTPLSDGRLLITNSGVNELGEGKSIPVTDAGIDIIDTSTIVGNISPGPVALSFKDLAVVGERAFIGSISYGEVYEIDLEKMDVMRGHDNPIVITGSEMGSDYLTDQALSFDGHYLFVSSFETSSVYPVDINVDPPEVLPDEFSSPFVVGFPYGVTEDNPSGENTGAGAVAVRPGVPDTDYFGPDLFVLTGYPGTLVTINTRGTGEERLSPIESITLSTESVLLTDDAPTHQLSASIVFQDGTELAGVESSFVNPFSHAENLLSWRSDDKTIAEILKPGLIKAVGEGKTVVKVNIGGIEASTDVEVRGGWLTSNQQDGGTNGGQDGGTEGGQESDKESGNDEGYVPRINLPPEMVERIINHNLHGLRHLQGCNTPEITSLEIEQAVINFANIGEHFNLSVKARFRNGTVLGGLHGSIRLPCSDQMLAITWRSFNPLVVVVDSNGVATAVGCGEAEVSASVSGITSHPVPARVGPVAERHPPAGADPFADGVVSYHVGTGGGFGSDRMPAVVLGPPRGADQMAGGTDVLSLGEGGEIILRFDDFVIADGPGPDFIVFENALYSNGNPNNPYAEPGIVGVSQDGVNFVDFPCNSGAPPYEGCAGLRPVYSNPDNDIDPTDPDVAGGDSFDLATVGMCSARFIRIRDAGECAPPCGAPLRGFDLDAAAVVNGAIQ